MPKKLPSSSEAPWITLLAYHQRNLDLTTICWNYWGVTEALAPVRQHSLHIWSFGQPAQILSAGYCPAGLSTGSSTKASRKLVHSLPQHSTAQTISGEQRFSNWLTEWITLELRKHLKDLLLLQARFVSKMTHCGDHWEVHPVSWDALAQDVHCVLRNVWKHVKDLGTFLRSYKSLVVNDNTCHE